MATSRVLRFQWSEQSADPDAYVLVRTSSGGKHELDLDLQATQGQNVFVGKVRYRKLKDLHSKSSQVDPAEWEKIIRHVMGVEDAPGAVALRDLEFVADISGEDPDMSLTIVLRKRIEQITQRLGSIQLSQDDGTEIEMFQWAGQLVQAANEQGAETARLTASLEEAKKTVIQLESQLEELVQAREEQEQQMLSRFASLLNEKKAKIRNQQRVLSTAKVDKQTLRKLEAAAEGRGRQAKVSSGKGKRKAEESVAPSESSDDFDTVAGEGNKRDNMQADTESDRGRTPGQDTDTDDEEEGAGPASAEVRPSTKGEPTSSPPPRRELPFTKRVMPKHDGGSQPSIAGPPKPKDDDDEETASDDDEL